MQTLLPYNSFEKSAKVLDNKRLGKQRVEAKKILETNLEVLTINTAGRWRVVDPELPNFRIKIPWENHPAVRMWRDYETCLAFYGFVMCAEWINRGFKDTLQSFFKEKAVSLNPETFVGAYFEDGYLPMEFLPP